MRRSLRNDAKTARGKAANKPKRLLKTALRPTPVIPSQTPTIKAPARGGGASTGALALRIQGGAVTTVASSAQLGAPTPVTPSQPLVAGQPPWKPQLPESVIPLEVAAAELVAPWLTRGAPSAIAISERFVAVSTRPLVDLPDLDYCM